MSVGREFFAGLWVFVYGLCMRGLVMIESKIGEITFTDDDVVNLDGWDQGERGWLFHDHGFVVGVVLKEYPAYTESDALDELVDSGKLDRYQVEDSQRDDEGITFLGNAGEPFDIKTLQMIELPPVPVSYCALFNAVNGRK